MNGKLNIVGINGSASSNSSNLAILKSIALIAKNRIELNILDDLTELPHFKTELTSENVPKKIIELRKLINNADGIIICTPEYVFSIPSGLKNVIEWCVSTTVFSGKPMGLITAAASGKKGHEELKLIMKTLEANFTDETTLLIQGIKGKMDNYGQFKEQETENKLVNFFKSFNVLIENSISREA